MIRFLIRLAVYLVAAAIGLLVAGLFLSGLSVSASGFIEVVLIFAVVQALLTQVLGRATDRRAPALSAGVGLFSALVSLVVTALLSDGLSVSGLGTWIGAAVIIWLVSMVAAFLLPILLVRMGIEHARERRDG
jgi:uncharacterized membrane protein YvlD (DUF360 family)